MLNLSRQKASSVLFKQILIFAVCLILFITSVAGSLFYAEYRQARADSCGDVFSPIPQWMLSRIDQNKAVYIQVQNETGVPWEVLAAVHFREYNLVVANPANGQGIYQLYSSGLNFPPGAITTEEFIRQTRLAANFIQGKAQAVPPTSLVSPRSLVANDDNISLIKSTLFSYNGRASAYAAQAATYGFSSTTHAYEGSPYVMNKFDCARKGMGLITSDGGNTLTATDTRMGAFTLYARLKGEGYWNGLQVGNIPGCSEATGTSISCVWRLYNPGKGNYIYTTSYDERNRYIAMGYSYQQTGFFGRNIAASRIAKQVPVYSLINGEGGAFLTTSNPEYLYLKGIGWEDKGIAFFANPANSNAGYPIYRMYNPTSGAHFWTQSMSDYNAMISYGFTSEGIAFNAVSTVLQEQPADDGQSLVYRFRDLPNNVHFWTTDINERDSMIRAGYTYDGVGWKSVQSQTNTAVFRMYSNALKQHLYTTSWPEVHDLATNHNWQYEGIAMYAANSGSPVYRLYRPQTGEHFYTTDASERQFLISRNVFLDEGIAWYQP